MTIEALVPIIVKALKEISEWPWETDNNILASPVLKRGGGFGSLVGHIGTWLDRDFVAASPLWLAQMVVGIVEERAGHKQSIIRISGNTYRPTRFRLGRKEKNPYFRWTEDDFIKEAVQDFGLSVEDYEWLKGKVGK